MRSTGAAASPLCPAADPAGGSGGTRSGSGGRQSSPCPSRDAPARWSILPARSCAAGCRRNMQSESIVNLLFDEASSSRNDEEGCHRAARPRAAVQPAAAMQHIFTSKPATDAMGRRRLCRVHCFARLKQNVCGIAPPAWAWPPAGSEATRPLGDPQLDEHRQKQGVQAESGLTLDSRHSSCQERQRTRCGRRSWKAGRG